MGPSCLLSRLPQVAFHIAELFTPGRWIRYALGDYIHHYLLRLYRVKAGSVSGARDGDGEQEIVPEHFYDEQVAILLSHTFSMCITFS